MKKNTSIILSLILLAQPVFVMATGSPTVDAATTSTTSATAATTSITTSQEILNIVKEYGLDTVAYTLAQKLGQKMSTLAINAANGGASQDKDPNYVKDFGTVFSKLEEQTRDVYTTKLLTNKNPYAREIAKDMLQGPYADQLSNFTLGNFMTNYGTDGAGLDTAKNDLSSLGGNGLAYFGELANPVNSPVGASLIAQNQLAQQVATKSKTETLKLTSSGFLPDTKCKSSITDYKKNVTKVIANDKQNSSNNTQINQNNNNIHTNNQIANGNYVPNSAVDPNDPIVTEVTSNPTTADLQAQNTQLQAQNSANGQSTAGAIKGLSEDTAGCIEEMVKNPIAAVSTITADAGKFGMDMTKNIKGWGQIVAGLFVSLFNGFIDTGLAGLKADYGQHKTKQTNTGGPEQLSQKTLGGGVTSNTNFATAPTVIIDLRNDLETSMALTEQNITTLKEVSKKLFLTPQRLAALDICLPGPDIIGLNKRLDTYYDQQTAWIQKSSATGSDNKNNIDQQLIISGLEQDYSIARAEMTQDITDDTKNIPGASAMRAVINTFPKKKIALQSVNTDITTSTDTLSQLRAVNTQLKNTVSFLKTLEPAALGSLPGTIFTTTEWAATPQVDRDAIYAWMKTHSPNKPVELTGQSETELDVSHMKYTIKNSWDLWEYPFTFFPAAPVLDASGQPTKDSLGNVITDKKWSDENADGTSVHADTFLEKKNETRGVFNNIKSIIPTEWEISKNEQLLASTKNDISRIDDLIHDCDKMRELIWGNTLDGSDGWMTVHNQGKGALIADMIASKDTYFKSDEVRNALTLPSIFTRDATLEEDGCSPDNTINYQATDSAGNNFSEHFDVGNPSVKYTCVGNFGHIYGDKNEGSIGDFSKWVDEGANAYQSSPHIIEPTELYWRSRILKFIPPPIPDPHGKGWTYSTLNDGIEVGHEVDGIFYKEGGLSRGLFCRLSAFQGIYAERSGGIDRPRKNFFCSSKWSDVSMSQALGLFLTDSLNY